MSPARVAYGLAAGLLQVACGERAGDPVVMLDSDSDSSGAGAGGGRASAGGSSASGSAPSDALTGPTGLCAPCQDSNSCGDANDACIRHEDMSFCGRDCDEGRGCPEGYACVELDNSRLRQCVPTSDCPSQLPAPPSLADARAYLLARINTERLARGRSTLAASACLDGLAQDSALAYARSDEPLGKYVKECDPIWPSCSCGWLAEAELSVAYYGLDWLSAIERAVADERASETFSEPDFARVGIGFWISGDEAWIALSFG